MDDRVAMEVAAQQHSVISLDQARAAGLSIDQVKYRAAAGLLVRSHEGIYRYASAPATHVQQLTAACLAAGQVSAVSHRSAAAVYRVWSSDFVEITVTRERAPELAGVTVHRIADLAPRWIADVEGLPVTSPARTLVDLGAVLPVGSVSRALDRALGRQLVGLAEVRSAMNAVARRGRVGVGVIRHLLVERSGSRTGTVLELRMATLLRNQGLPPAVPEHTVLDAHGQFVGRVDFAYPELRYAIEVDGYEPHLSLRAFRHDRARQNDLVDLGWTVHRFTWDDVESHPARVAHRILGRLRGNRYP